MSKGNRRINITAEVNFPIQEIDKLLTRGVRDGMNAIGITLVRNISGRSGVLSREGTGKHYKGNPAKSSKKGEFPVAQTGRLRLSWMVKLSNPVKMYGKFVGKVKQRGVGGGVESPVRYGYILETSPRLKRKYIGGPKGALAMTKKTAQKVFQAELEESIRRANKVVK